MRIIKWGIAIAAIAIIIVGFLYYPRLHIITGFSAKNVCSCIFEAKRSLESVEAGDNNFQPVSFTKNTVDYEEGVVTSTFFGLQPRKAIYREGAGCTLITKNTPIEFSNTSLPQREDYRTNIPYPFGTGAPIAASFDEVNTQKLQAAIENAFDRDGKEVKKTRAVVVLYKNALLAEKYAAKFDENTPQQGWSMTKSITNAVLGVLEKQGRVSLEQDKLFPEWANDDRAEITLNNLLQMNSGLEWEEDYTTISDVTKMLFLAKDMTSVQLNKPLVEKPNKAWNYSSGTSNLLSRFIRDQFHSSTEYSQFWYEALIDKIGMHSMTVEKDMIGNFVGSSYAWATPRDWAKFGLLYLNRGNWNKEQILTDGWVAYSSSPATNSQGAYGAHFWLNAGGKYPNAPLDLFSSNGFQGQYIFIIPSKNLVIVRFGLAEDPVFNVDDFLKGILSAIE